MHAFAAVGPLFCTSWHDLRQDGFQQLAGSNHGGHTTIEEADHPATHWAKHGSEFYEPHLYKNKRNLQQRQAVDFGGISGKLKTHQS